MDEDHPLVRIAVALEHIANSLANLTTPIITVTPTPPTGDYSSIDIKA